MKPTIIKIHRRPGQTEGPDAYPGWIVPDTEELMAVDMRAEADAEWGDPAVWVITHLPTGARVSKWPYTCADTRARAVEVAQNFFREAMARGWPLHSSDMDAMPTIHNEMSLVQKQEFWEAVGRETSA